MNAAGERFRHFGIDLAAKAGQAAEGGLDMTAGAAEPVIKVKMAECGVEVVPPHQAYHPAAKPDAFGVARWAADLGGRLGKFIHSALGLLRRITLGGLWRLVAWLRVAGLSECGQRSQREKRRTKCNGQDDGTEGHDRAGFYGVARPRLMFLMSLYNDWVSITTGGRSAAPRCRMQAAFVQYGQRTCLK